MIIFSPIRDIPVEMLEFKGLRQVVKYNLSHYYAEMPTLNCLVPSPNCISEEIMTGDCCNADFDQAYHKYILDNNQAFHQFMSIIVPAYMNPDTLVHITILPNDYSDAITESLVKLIQQRYGYNSYIINNIDDFYYVEEQDPSIPGLFMIDQDLQRWRILNENQISGDLYE